MGIVPAHRAHRPARGIHRALSPPCFAPDSAAPSCHGPAKHAVCCWQNTISLLLLNSVLREKGCFFGLQKWQVES